jgi:hypothetical protein
MKFCVSDLLNIYKINLIEFLDLIFGLARTTRKILLLELKKYPGTSTILQNIKLHFFKNNYARDRNIAVFCIRYVTNKSIAMLNQSSF